MFKSRCVSYCSDSINNRFSGGTGDNSFASKMTKFHRIIFIPNVNIINLISQKLPIRKLPIQRDEKLTKTKKRCLMLIFFNRILQWYKKFRNFLTARGVKLGLILSKLLKHTGIYHNSFKRVKLFQRQIFLICDYIKSHILRNKLMNKN